MWPVHLAALNAASSFTYDQADRGQLRIPSLDMDTWIAISLKMCSSYCLL